MASLRQIVCLVASAFLPLASLSIYAQGNKRGEHASNTSKDKQTLPLVFEENRGQFPSGIGFVGKTERYSVAVESGDLRFVLPGKHGAAEVVLSLAGGQAAALTGLAEAPFRTNYFMGSDPSAYRTGVRNYTRIGLSHVYPGVDAEFYATGNSIEHDFLLAPGADPDRIAMRFATQGRKAVLSREGDVVLASGEGELRLRKPVAYQIRSNGTRVEVAAAFTVSGDAGQQEVRFKLGAYDHSRALTVDPIIEYGSFFDGVAGSTATALASDAAGDVFLTGYTASAAPSFHVENTHLDVPVSMSAAASSAVNSAPATFVAKFNPAGSASPVAWLSYFGDSGYATTASSLALQPVANPAYFSVGGSTMALNLPTTTGAVLPHVATSARRGFIVTFSTADGSLAASTYLDSAPDGGTAATEVNALAMDRQGNVYAVGSATGSGLVTTSNALAVDGTVLTSGARKGFVVELTPGLSAEPFATYLSGNQVADTTLTSVVLDPGGNVYVGGYTAGSFPKAGTYGAGNMYAHNANDRSGSDAFAIELAPGQSGTTLKYSTWLSGSGDEKVNALALDTAGNLLVFGQTASSDLLTSTVYTSAARSASVDAPASTSIRANAKPVSAAFPGKTSGATTSGFAAKLDPNGQPMVVTYLGGTGDDVITSGIVDPAGRVFAAGHSSSSQSMSYAGAKQLPVEQDMTAASQQHGFLLQMPGDLSAVKAIANIGGNAGPDTAVALGLDAAGSVYLGGNVSSRVAYTSSGAFQQSRSTSTGTSAYVSKIQADPGGADPGLALTAVPCPTATASPNQPVGCPDPIGLPSTPNVTYTFSLAPSATAATPAVAPTLVQIQIPPVSVLTYNTCTVTDTTPAVPVQIACVINASGATATLAAYPQTTLGTNDTLSIVLGATLSSEPTGAVIGVTANVASFDTASPANAYATLTATENSNLAAVLSIASARQTPTGAAPTVYTTDLAVATAPASAQVSYTFTLGNSGPSDAVGATFSLPATAPFTIGSISAIATGTASGTASCSVANNGCSALTIPAGSANTIVVTVSGVYPNSALGASSSVAAPAFTVSAAAPGNTASSTFTPGITLQRGVHLAISSSVLTASTRTGGDFYLDDALTYTVTVANDGPSATLDTDNDTLTISLPTNAVFTPTGTGLTCTATTCTATLPALPANGTAQYTFTGSFPDASNTAVHGTHVQTTFNVATQIAAGTAVDANSGTAGDTASSFQPFVVRYAVLSFSSSGYTQTATQCANSSPCLDMQNASNTGYALYSVQVTSAGPNLSENTNVTITLPTAGAGHPLLLFGTPQVTGVSGFTTAPTCTYTAASPAQGTIVCSGFNMPKGASFTVSGSLTADSATVPATASFVNVAASSGNAAITQDAQGAQAPVGTPAIEVDRVAHVVTTKTVALTGPSLSPGTPTVNLAENTAATPGVNDTLTVTLTVGTAALNALPSATLTDTLPSYFQLITAPKATTSNGAGATCTYTDPSAVKNAKLTCNLTSLAPAASVAASPATQVTVTYSGKFVDKGATGPDITGDNPSTKAPQYTGGLLSAASTIALAVDPGPASDLTSAAPALTVERLVHMMLRKARNTTGTLKAVLNLDEETGTSKANGFGNADELEYDVAVTNSGVNQALGVQFTDVLPPYFTLVNAYAVSGAPATPDGGGAPGGQLATGSLACYSGAAATGTPLSFPHQTTGTESITCTYGIPNGSPANPLALAPSGSFEFVYQGKFQDNAPATDTVPLGQSSYSFSSAAGAATTTATQSVDSGTPTASAALGPFTVQRAVHLTLVLPSNPVRSLDEKTVPLTLAGEAQPSSTGGTPVINCVRYKAYIQNSGPNIARQATLTVGSQNGLSLASSAFGTTTVPNTNGGTDGALPDTGCAFSSTSITSATISQPSTLGLAPLTEAASGQTPSLVVDVDGYFGLGTLAAPNNSLPEVGLKYSTLGDASSVDTSGVVSTLNSPGAITVVNTPAGANFLVSPFASMTGTQPVALSFSSVASAGITNLTVATSSTLSLPSGPSPVPGSSSTAIPLYKSGTNPQFYSVGTTAGAVTGNTGICITNPTAGNALSDGFAKPERVLLWGLANVVASPTFGSVPSITSSPAGDITSTVVPTGAAAYVQPGGPLSPYDAGHTTLPAKQAQPLRVCGNVSGLATSPSQGVFAVLEPVNFAPIIIPNLNSPSQTPGKGVSEVSFLFPTGFDPDNADPCYVTTTSGGPITRSKCDDNAVLTTRVFGGEVLVPSQNHTVGPMTPDVTATFDGRTFEVQAGATLYDLVTDQLGEVIYQAANCDPGTRSTQYTPGSPCTGAYSGYNVSNIKLSGTPQQGTDFGSGVIAQLFPSLNGGSSALIILPTVASQTQSGYVAATGTVTAGQSVGFLWRLRLDTSAVSGTYNLTCFMVDAATQTTVVPFPAGLSCQVPATDTLPTDIPIYIVTQGSLYAKNSFAWQMSGGLAFATLLVPFLLFRRRLAYPKQLVIIALLSLASIVGLSGCGSGGAITSASTAVAPGIYWFRVSATPTGGGAAITSTAFSVKVVAGN